ncbi:hypothetical protein Scel_40170 [Streptomyces cellostaticus]|nr:hypothetical protein Scel_40170 [Streptomyces cellostaticus]
MTNEQDTRRELLREHFAGVCVEPARRLHADGRVEKLFGRPLPVVIFGMYRPGREVAATGAAGPPGLIEGVLQWQQAAEAAQGLVPALIRTPPPDAGPGAARRTRCRRRSASPDRRRTPRGGR